MEVFAWIINVVGIFSSIFGVLLGTPQLLSLVGVATFEQVPRTVSRIVWRGASEISPFSTIPEAVREWNQLWTSTNNLQRSAKLQLRGLLIFFTTLYSVVIPIIITFVLGLFPPVIQALFFLLILIALPIAELGRLQLLQQWMSRRVTPEPALQEKWLKNGARLILFGLLCQLFSTLILNPF